MMNILVQDSFNRANNTTSLGISETGQSWQVLAGVWGISDNKAYKVSSGTALAVVESGIADVQISVDRIYNTSVNRDGQIAFRVSSASNFLMFRWNSFAGEIQIYKFVNGAATKIAGKSKALAENQVYKFKVVANEASIKCYIDSVLEFEINETHNQTATKHGIRQFENNAEYYDNFIVESLVTGGGEPIGEDGSVAFDSRQSIYESSLTQVDTKQVAYADGTFATDLRHLLYVDQSQATDTRIAIYQDGATTQDTAQVLYEMSAVAFDTLQELFNDGQVGTTPFDVRVRLYEDNSAILDTKQAVYDGGLLRYDVAQVIYESNTAVADVKAVIYADSALKADVVQSIYADGEFDADTLQRILAEFSEYSEVVRIGLEITQRRREALEITQQFGSDLEIVQRRVIELNL